MDFHPTYGILRFLRNPINIQPHGTNQEQQLADNGEINDSPIEQVRLTVPITDDPTLPVLTFRIWILGPITCVFLSIYTEYTHYRQIGIPISRTFLTLIYLPIGKLLAAKLPTRTIRIPGTNREFSMNPGPFNVKEHVLLDKLGNSGLSSNYSLGVISVTRVLYHKNVSFWAAFLLVHTTQMIGYGFAGIFRKYLVNSPYMWWPATLPEVSFYRMMHEVELRPKGQLTRIQFFILVTVSSFAYAIIPNYLFPSIISLSFVCWIWKDSVTAHQIGSGLNGLGIGSFTIDWSSIAGYAGDPLAMPMFAVVNMFVGFILLVYIAAPIAYWTNSHNAKRFPLISMNIYDANGQIYNTSRIIKDDFSFDQQEYNNYSNMYLSVFSIYSTYFMLAAETSALTHFILYHSREAYKQLKQFKQGLKGGEQSITDVHNRLMKKYETVPRWWFYIIIASTVALAILNSVLYGKQFQLSIWAMLFGYALPLILILPAGVIQASTGQGVINMHSLAQLLMGLIYPGNPVTNMAFQACTDATNSHTMDFLSDFKLAHYMKIPPKSMFIAQIVGSIINSYVSLSTQWWILSSIKNICDKKKLPEGSPWTCPMEHISFTNTMMWGGLGPTRMFASNGEFSDFYIFLIIGVVATFVIWLLVRLLPEKKWIGLIHIPLILSSGLSIPPAGTVNYWSMFTVAVIFNFFIYKKYKEWWSRYNYLLSGALFTGIGLMSFTATLSLQTHKNIYGLKWWGLEFGDHCPLATCPTAPGIKVDGCPIF